MKEFASAPPAGQPPMPQQQPGAAPPPANTPAGGPAPGQQAQEQQSGEGQPPQTVELLVDQINQIRAGKSLADPAVYKSLADFYDTLQPQEKTLLQRVMDSIAGAVNGGADAGSQPQTQGNAAVQQGQAPPAPAGTPAQGGGGGMATQGAPMAAI